VYNLEFSNCEPKIKQNIYPGNDIIIIIIIIKNEAI